MYIRPLLSVTFIIIDIIHGEIDINFVATPPTTNSLQGHPPKLLPPNMHHVTPVLATSGYQLPSRENTQTPPGDTPDIF